jgi:hypothetical protein
VAWRLRTSISPDRPRRGIAEHAKAATPCTAFKSRAQRAPVRRRPAMLLNAADGVVAASRAIPPTVTVMNDRTPSDLNAPAEGSTEKHETLALFEKLQDLRGKLRKLGVVRVLAAYKKNALNVAFLNSQHIPMLVPDLDAVADELARLLAIVIRRRCPDGSPSGPNSGTFDWQLVEDILIHEQTVTYRGIP